MVDPAIESNNPHRMRMQADNPLRNAMALAGSGNALTLIQNGV